MWANVQRDGRPVDYRWRPVFNAALWLTPTTRVPRSIAAKTRNPMKLECGPVPNVMVALPNIGGALYSTPQSLADAHY